MHTLHTQHGEQLHNDGAMLNIALTLMLLVANLAYNKLMQKKPTKND